MKPRLSVSDPMLTAMSVNTLYIIGKYNVNSRLAGVIAWYAMREHYSLLDEPLTPRAKMLRHIIEKLAETEK